MVKIAEKLIEPVPVPKHSRLATGRIGRNERARI
jgi:hypothetical protein